MSVTALKKSKKPSTKKKAVSGSKIKDYGKDPFFVKKAKDAKAFLRKHGLPATPSR